MTVVALSYAGTFTVTVSADPDQVPDLPVLVEALQAELDGLTAAEVPCRQDQRPQRRAGARS